MSVLVEHGGGGSRVAAPIARDIMAKTLELDPMSRPVFMELPPLEQKEQEELEAGVKDKGQENG